MEAPKIVFFGVAPPPTKIEAPPSSSLEDGAIVMSTNLALTVIPPTEIEVVVEPEPEKDTRTIVTVTEVKDVNAFLSLIDYDEPVVEELRRTPGRNYSHATKQNVIPLAELPKLLERLLALNVNVVWAEGTWERYVEFKDRKDYHIKFNHNKSKIKLEAQHSKVVPLYSSDMVSFEKDWRSAHCFVAVAEAHKLPTQIEHWQSYKATFKVDDDVKDFIEAQLMTRTALLELSTAKDVEYEVDPLMLMPSKASQRVALKYADLIGKRIIVSYDMGMGKSYIAIAFIEKLAKDLGRDVKALILCPATLKRNWEIEIRKFTKRSANVFSGIQPNDVALQCLFQHTTRYNIINYDIIGRGEHDKDSGHEVRFWPRVINMAAFDVIVYDEGHYMRNMDSQRSKGGRELKAPYTMILTGTPIMNRPAEIYPLLSIVAPETFHNIAAFESQFLRADGSSKNDKAFRDMLSLYTVRRVRDPVEVDAIDYTVELDKNAREHYEKVLEGIYVALRNPDYQRNVNNILTEILRLKQICSSAKIELAAELATNFIQESEEGRDKVIIFSQFLDTIRHLTKALGSNAMVLTGETTTDEKYSIIDKFQNDPSKKVLIASTKASSEGITLTAAHCVIFCDLMWTPASHMQAEGRAFGRVNDPHGGVAYYLLAEKTIEDSFIYPLLSQKRSMINRLIDNVHQDAEENENMIKALIKHLRGF